MKGFFVLFDTDKSADYKGDLTMSRRDKPFVLS